MVDLVTEVFSGLVFELVAPLDQFYDTYAARIKSSISGNYHNYILAFVPSSVQNKKTAYISSLKWVNVSSRLIKKSEGYQLQPQTLNFPSKQPIMFGLISRDKHGATYNSDDGSLEMVLKNDPSVKSNLQHYSRYNLYAAILTFRCSISVMKREEYTFL